MFTLLKFNRKVHTLSFLRLRENVTQNHDVKTFRAAPLFPLFYEAQRGAWLAELIKLFEAKI